MVIPLSTNVSPILTVDRVSIRANFLQLSVWARLDNATLGRDFIELLREERVDVSGTLGKNITLGFLEYHHSDFYSPLSSSVVLR